MDKRMRFLEMEVVRLTNRLASRDEYVSFLESELKSVESEHAEELALKDEFIAGQAETISNLRKEKEDAMEDAADARKELGEARAVILSLQGMIIESNADKNQLEKENEDKQKLADLATKAKMDFKDIVNLLRTEQEIGRFNVPKNDPMCSKHPQSIIKGNPVMPSSL